MKTLYLLLFTLFFCSTSFAQVIVSIEDTTAIIVEENITIYKDARLDILEKRPALIAKEEKYEVVNYKPLVSADGKKRLTGSIYTQKGFRVVIYNGPDKEKAIQSKNAFTRAFPDVPSYIAYNVPSFKIKVGNFESRNEASAFLRTVNKAFPTSFIVPDIVTIKNINVSN